MYRFYIAILVQISSRAHPPSLGSFPLSMELLQGDFFLTALCSFSYSGGDPDQGKNKSMHMQDALIEVHKQDFPWRIHRQRLSGANGSVRHTCLVGIRVVQSVLAHFCFNSYVF